MIIECEKKSVNLKSMLTKNKNLVWVEQDILVPDSKPDVMKIVMVKATPYISNKEIDTDKIKIDGKINYYIIYKTSDDLLDTRGMYMTYPFTTTLSIKNINKDTNVDLDIDIGNIIYSLPNERKISIKSEMIIHSKHDNNMMLDIIEKFPEEYNIQVKKKECKCMNYKLNKNSVIASKEEILLSNENNDFYEILNIETKIQNTDFKESYNKIMVKGEILLDVLYLTDSNKSQVNSMPLEIPFSGMIELDNISDKSKFDLKYKLKDLSIKVNLENGASKMMEIDYQVDVSIQMYEEDEISYIEDFYSQNCEIKADIKELTPVSNKIVSYKNIDIKETVTNILNNNYRMLNCSGNINNINTSVNENTCILDGNVKIDMLIQNTDTGEIESKNIEILVNETIPISKINDNNKLDINICLDKLNIVIMNRDLEVKLRININIVEEENLQINYTNNLELSDEYIDNLDSMYIYMVKNNDTLWDIAKKYKTTIDNIMKTNSIT